MKKYILLFLVTLLSSCALGPKPVIAKKDYLADKVSVDTSIRLAFAAYMKSCKVDAKLPTKVCKQKAQVYIEEYILEIMNQ
tara:strand:- start:8024 stop:8266 length:243 start_codon:yes stop_codon:yes gene_type:complete